MLVKLCGLTDPATAKEAALSGANFIGLLFSAKSTRCVSLGLAKQIAQAAREGGAEVVGVFVDEGIEEILKIVQALDLHYVQLHGDNPRKACSALPAALRIIYVADGGPLPIHLDPNKDFLLFERMEPTPKPFRFFIAGGLNSGNVANAIQQLKPDGVDVSSGIESAPAIKDLTKIKTFIQKVKRGRFGPFGGMYVPELLVQPLKELEAAFLEIGCSLDFRQELGSILRNYAGRPTALTEVPRFAQVVGNLQIFLKREDLLHTGAHKINNALGQCLLAKKRGQTRIIAETGAGQHGVATATACALFGLECVIYMGQVDMERQAPNVAKMSLLGAQVISVKNGAATLKEAVNEALRDWAQSYETTHYCLGSALGPHPFPTVVAEFQKIIGLEAKQQFFERVGRHPDCVVACVGGGSNAIGLFSAYLHDLDVELIGVEAGGRNLEPGNHAARFHGGSAGILHGSYTYILQTEDGQIIETHSVSAGLDYPAVAPQHADLFQRGRARYERATDAEALAAFHLMAKTEGIIPALESAHALGFLMAKGKEMGKNPLILVNLSGRGDKDLCRV